MVSPLFRTLSIATLRYRHEDVEIVKSEIFSNVELEFENRTLDCEFDDNAIDLNLQNFSFQLVLDDNLDLEAVESGFKLEKDC